MVTKRALFKAAPGYSGKRPFFAWCMVAVLASTFFLAAARAGEAEVVAGPAADSEMVPGYEIPFREGEPVPAAPPGMHWALIQKPFLLPPPRESNPALPKNEGERITHRLVHSPAIMVWRLQAGQIGEEISECMR